MTFARIATRPTQLSKSTQMRPLPRVCAGTFPSMFYHLSLFFNEGELSLAYALMLMSLSMSQVIGEPCCVLR